MKLIITSNEGIVITEFQNVDKLNLKKDIDGWRVLGFVRAGIKHGKLLDQADKDEKKQA